MSRVIVYDTFKATITIGLHRGYSKQNIQETEVINLLQCLQNELISGKGVYLSANCYLSNVVLSGQIEPHINLQFINYPKFPIAETIFKEIVEHIAAKLMDGFDQNRVVIQFHDSNVMLEKSVDIDPRIRE
jgi:hypothetical protein